LGSIGKPGNDACTPLQLPSVKNNSSCEGYARNAEEESRMRKKYLSKKRNQKKDGRHLYLSIK